MSRTKEVAQCGALTHVNVVNEHASASEARDLGSLVRGTVIEDDDLVRILGGAQHEAADRYLFVVARNANHDRRGSGAVRNSVEFRHIHRILLEDGQGYSAAVFDSVCVYRVRTRHKVCCLPVTRQSETLIGVVLRVTHLFNRKTRQMRSVVDYKASRRKIGRTLDRPRLRWPISTKNLQLPSIRRSYRSCVALPALQRRWSHTWS